MTTTSQSDASTTDAATPRVLTRSLLGHPDRPELVFQRDYATSAADLWAACTDPERLSRWFGTVHGDPQGVGDGFEARLSVDESDVARGAVLRCDGKQLVVTWSWPGEPDSLLTATVHPLGEDRSRLTLHHALGAAQECASYGGGWEELLGSLAGVLEQTRGSAPPSSRPSGQRRGVADDDAASAGDRAEVRRTRSERLGRIRFGGGNAQLVVGALGRRRDRCRRA